MENLILTDVDGDTLKFDAKGGRFDGLVSVGQGGKTAAWGANVSDFRAIRDWCDGLLAEHDGPSIPEAIDGLRKCFDPAPAINALDERVDRLEAHTTDDLADVTTRMALQLQAEALERGVRIGLAIAGERS